LEQIDQIKAKFHLIANEHGYELVELKGIRLGGRTIIRVYVHKQGGVTIKDCKDLSKACTDYLDMEDIIQGRYNLEVSSLGLDRPLLTQKDFQRRIGETVSLELTPAENEKSLVEGILLSTDETGVTISKDNQEFHYEFDRIIRGKIIF